ncbi:hypothetical protein BGZ94_007907 [Podila epigama]|nr:hypothetical protein BGZ94_007907 [Podila epigama]
MAPKIHPLHLPEIISRVGWFIHLWDDDIFEPDDLVACIQVNRTWRTILTPLLWRVFDMSAYRDWDVPEEILQANAHHIRYLGVHRKSLEPCWTTRNLRALHCYTFTNARLLFDLALANPGLTEICWDFPLQYLENRERETLSTLESLTQLTVLHLKRWRDYNGRSSICLAKTLSNNPLLKTLILHDLRGVNYFDGCVPLLNLTHLVLDCDWNRSNPGLPSLVRYCPNLETLEYQPEEDCPIAELSLNLRECCPKLRHLYCSKKFNAHEYYPIWHWSQDIEPVKAGTGFETLDLPMQDLRPQLCEAILDRHYNTLVNLHLYVYRRLIPSAMASMSLILENCTNLRMFTAEACGSSWTPEDCFALFDRPWTPKLESIMLQWVTTGLDRSKFRVEREEDLYDIEEPAGPYQGDDVYELFERDPDIVPSWQLNDEMSDIKGATVDGDAAPGLDLCRPNKLLDKYGWELDEEMTIFDAVELDSRNSNLLLRRMLDRVGTMPNMRDFQISRYRYQRK